MTRQQFIASLRGGLSGLSPATIEEIVSDYEGHFSEGMAAGRSETEVAEALGDPARHAREIRAEAGLKRWETERSATSAAGAVFAVLGLGALDLIVAIPFLTSIGGVILAFFMVAVALFGVGAVCMVAGPFWIAGGPPAAIVLAGMGMMSLGVFFGAGTTLCTIGIINALVWYGRLHLRVFRPALASNGGIV
jgi:uncharacterized membrane protein